MLRSAPNEARKKRREGRGDKEEAIRKRQQGGIRILTKSLIIQVPYHPSPLSSKSLIIQVPHWPNHVLLLSTNLGFSFPVLSPGWKVFSSIISTFMIFWFSSLSLSSVGRFFMDWSLVRFFFSVSHYRVRRFFTSNIILLRLISFPTGLRCSYLSPGFLPHSISLVRRFFTRFPFLNRRYPCSTELASKREGNCNVMVTRPTNHMISTHDHSHDLVTWSRHVTYKLHPDIIVSSIPISASLFPYHDYVLLSFIIEARVFSLSWTSSRCLEVLLPDLSSGGEKGGFPRSLLMKATRGLTSRSIPIQDPVVVV